MNSLLGVSMVIAGGFVLLPTTEVNTSIAITFASRAPMTSSGAITVTLLFAGATTGVTTGATTGRVGVDVGVPPESPPPLTTASAVLALAEEDASEVPIALAAVTVNVYVVPSESPLIVQLVVADVHVVPTLAETV